MEEKGNQKAFHYVSDAIRSTAFLAFLAGGLRVIIQFTCIQGVHILKFPDNIFLLLNQHLYLTTNELAITHLCHKKFFQTREPVEIKQRKLYLALTGNVNPRSK